jgi:predicted AlkP superfamily phosphohydrolase/phosphomutase
VTRLLVVGLDGGTEAVLGLPDAGCPNIAALRAEGASGVLRSTVPPITSTAWPSMLTGLNPGKHGIYDFRALAADRYTRLWSAGHSAAFADGREFATSRHWAGSAFWDLLDPDMRVAVLSVPMTYPAWKVNGQLVAGFPLPDYERNHTYPAELAGELPPLLSGADKLGRLDDAELAAFCRRLIERQSQIVRDWVEEGEYDVVFVVFQSTDFAQHRLWRYLDQAGHPLREALLELYRDIDGLIGELRELLGDESTVAVVSDHGFGPHPRAFVRTDAVLARAGLLALTSGEASGSGTAAQALRRVPGLRRRLRLLADRLPGRAKEWLAGRYTGANQVDWSRTLAYRIPLYAPAEGVAVNLKGRQSEGVVEPGEEYEDVRQRVIDALLELRDPESGAAAVQWALRREEVYSGAHLDEAPDVVALFDPRFKGGAGLGELFEPPPDSLLETYSGVHAMDGIFAVAGPDVVPGVDLGTRQIVDVAPTLLAVLGVPIPADVDGAVMTEALREPAVVASAAANGDREAASRWAHAGPDPELTQEEEATLEESLRALGYLD